MCRDDADGAIEVRSKTDNTMNQILKPIVFSLFRLLVFFGVVTCSDVFVLNVRSNGVGVTSTKWGGPFL